MHLNDHFFNLRNKFIPLIFDFRICNVQVHIKFIQVFLLYRYKIGRALDIFPEFDKIFYTFS
jgi:hypothetical protein